MAEERLKKRESINSLFQKSQVRYFLEFFGKHKKVLDVGCGYGYFTKLIKPYADEICAIDTENSIAPSILNDGKIKFSIGSGCDIPYENECFDCVYSMDVIEHVEDDKLFIKENIRVLKREGSLIIGTPNKNRLSALLKKIIFKPNKYPLVIKDLIFGTVIHIREYSRNELLNLLTSFNEIKIEKIRAIYFGLTEPVNIGLSLAPSFLKNLCQF